MKRIFLTILLLMVPIVVMAQNPVTVIGGVATIDASTCFGGASGASCAFKVILTANTTVSIINARGGQTLGIFFLENATGGWTVTWPSYVVSPPGVTSTANVSTLVNLQYDSSGGTWSVSGGGTTTFTTLTGTVSCLDVTPTCVSDHTVLDASTTNTSNIVTCPNSDCKFLTTAAVGQIVQGGTATQGIVLPITTIQSVDSDTQIHTVGNATATGTGTVYLGWGVDNTASLDALDAASQKVCKYGYIPAGWYFTSHATFITQPGSCANSSSGRVGGIIGSGGWINSKILIRYDINYATCTGGISTHACFNGVLATDWRSIAIDGMYNNTNPGTATYIIENNAGYFDRVGVSGAPTSIAPANLNMMFYSGIEPISRESASVGGASACTIGSTGTIVHLDLSPCINAGVNGLLTNNGSQYFSKGSVFSGTSNAIACVAGSYCNHDNDTFSGGAIASSGTSFLQNVFLLTGTIAHIAGTMTIADSIIPGASSSQGGVAVTSGAVTTVRNVKFNNNTSFVNNGTMINEGQVALNVLPTGTTGKWLGVGVLTGTCRGTATSSATLGLYLLGENSTPACTSTTVNQGQLITQVPLSGSAFNLNVTAGTGCKSGNTCVFTVLKNNAANPSTPVATTLTCSMVGPASTCQDVTHFDIPVVGDTYSIQFTTGATETLANVTATLLSW